MTGAADRVVERALARQRRKVEEEVERLVTAAVAVMRERDTVDPTVSDILATAGMSTAAFYRHFPAKDDLLLTLLEHASATTASYVGHVLGGIADPVERVRAWVGAMFDLLRTDELVAVNRPFLLAHARLVERFPAEVAASTVAVGAPLAAAVAEARAALGQPAGDPVNDARLAHHQVLSLLVDQAAERRTTDPADVAAVVGYTLRAVLGVLPPAVGAGPGPEPDVSQEVRRRRGAAASAARPRATRGPRPAAG